MGMSVPTGIRELQLAPGDHVCAFYRGPDDRDGVLMPYLRTGMNAGDKCICIVDSSATADQVRSLQPAADTGAQQLDVHVPETSYLAGGGFSREDMLAFWMDHLNAAADDGYPFSRLVGEMTWALRPAPGVENLVLYEAELNRVAPKYPTVVLCLYDLDRFTGEVIVSIVKTHPKVLIRGMVVENPYYVGPDEFLAESRLAESTA
jgi:MEDS: MEthanogen/methylotroph, DcmR Sensory domain